MKYVIPLFLCFNVFAMNEICKDKVAEIPASEPIKESDTNEIDYKDISNIDFSKISEEEKKMILLKHFSCLDYCEF